MTASPAELVFVATSAVEAGGDALFDLFGGVSTGGASSVGPLDAIDVETDGTADLLTNGMPIVGRIEHRDAEVNVDCLFIVEDNDGLRTAGVLSAMAFATCGVPDVESVGGGALLLCSRLDGDALVLLEDESESRVVLLALLRCLGAAALRPDAPTDGTLFHWTAPEPAPRDLQPCELCDDLLPVNLPYSRRRHSQVHLAATGPGAPAHGACVDVGLAGAVGALWGAGLRTTDGCQGDDDSDRLDGYLAMPAGDLAALLERLGAKHVAPGVSENADEWRLPESSIILCLSEGVVRFRGSDRAEFCRRVEHALAEGSER